MKSRKKKQKTKGLAKLLISLVIVIVIGLVGWRSWVIIQKEKPFSFARVEGKEKEKKETSEKKQKKQGNQEKKSRLGRQNQEKKNRLERQNKEKKNRLGSQNQEKKKPTSEAKEFSGKQESKIPVHVAKPIFDKVVSSLEQTSTLEPMVERKVFSQQSGIITFLKVEVGERVKENSLLLQLDKRDVLLNFESSQIQFQQAQEDFQRETRIHELKLEANVTIKNAKYQYENSQVLWQKSQDDLAKLEREWKRAQQSLKQKTLSTNEYEDLRYRYNKATLDEQRARIDYQKFEDEWKRIQGLDQNKLLIPESLVNARNNFLNAENSLKRAKLVLEQMEVKAPLSGVLIHKMVKEGDSINPNTHLFTIAQVDRLQAKVTIAERDLLRVKKGQPVELTLEAFDSVPSVKGKIHQISPLVDTRSGTAEVIIYGTNPSPNFIRPGMFVRARITTDERSNALLIPRKALLFQGEKILVYVVEADKAVKRTLTTGYSGDGFVEILSGVEANDQVIVEGQHGLNEGSLVKVLEKG